MLTDRGTTEPQRVEGRFRATLDSLLEGFQIIGRDWKYLYVNPAAAHHGQRRPDELLGRTMMEAYPGIDATPLFAKLSLCMERREGAAFDTAFTFADGATRWFEVRVEPVPEGLCIHSVDIQARKQAEAALREQEHAARLGAMAATIAQEVRNPLAAIAGGLDTIRARRGGDDADAPVVDEMRARISALDRLMEELLVFARPVRVQSRALVVGELVTDVARLVESDPVVRRHTITWSGRVSTVVSGDQPLLRTVLHQLVLNAAQAMAEEGQIWIEVTSSPGVCWISVSDAGKGVPGEIRDRIFDPFFTTRPDGTGLGLPIGRRIMRLHGGDLELGTGRGPGATLVMTLPIGDVAQPGL